MRIFLVLGSALLLAVPAVSGTPGRKQAPERKTLSWSGTIKVNVYNGKSVYESGRIKRPAGNRADTAPCAPSEPPTNYLSSSPAAQTGSTDPRDSAELPDPAEPLDPTAADACLYSIAGHPMPDTDFPEDNAAVNAPGQSNGWRYDLLGSSAQLRGTYTEAFNRMTAALERHRDTGRVSDDFYEKLAKDIDHAANLDRLQRLTTGGHEAHSSQTMKVEGKVSDIARQLNQIDPLHPVAPFALGALRERGPSMQISFGRQSCEMKHLLETFHMDGALEERDYERHRNKLADLVEQESAGKNEQQGELDAYKERELAGKLMELAKEVSDSIDK